MFSASAKAQDQGSFYVFDASWKATKIQSAHFMLHTYQINDTCWQWDYYNFMGPLIKTEQYRDKDGKEINGICCYYKPDGVLDSLTTYRKGKKNGDSWKTTGERSAIGMRYEFKDDSLISAVDESKKKKDSVISFKDEKESQYPGGLPAWSRYLKDHIEYPERAQAGNIQGGVWVQFIVDEDGNVNSARIARSVEYSLDEEALKIINESGKWVPSFQNGRHVKAYKMQPINFRL